MKKLIVFLGLMGCMTAVSAHAAVPSHLASNPVKIKMAAWDRSIRSVPAAVPYSCTVTVSGSLNGGFGSVTASCSSTESNCDLATQSAASCLGSVLRFLKAQLK
jgi:hypothetical protein